MSQAKATPSAMLTPFMQRVVGHYHAWRECLHQLQVAPFASVMTILVIAITLTLPADLLILLNNAKALGQGWDKNTQISLYLKTSTAQSEIDQLVQDLQARDDITNVDYISPQQGLQHFKEQSGLGNILDQLPDNPLPGVIVVYPDPVLSSPEKVAALLHDLQKLQPVELAQLDLAWLNKLYSLIRLGQRGTIVLGLFFGLAMILIIGNTIRLVTYNQRHTIEVSKLIGGTSAFIRRPFLYLGAVHGFLGGCAALLLIYLQLLMIHRPYTQLMESYASQHNLHGLGFMFSFYLLAASTLLGLLSAFVIASRQIAKLQPQ